MKGLIFILLSLSAMAEVCVEGKTSKWDATGTFLGPYETCYIKVSNNSGGTLAKGTLVISDTTQTNPQVVTTSTTAGAVPLCVLQQSCAASAKCNCQTYGYNDYALLNVASNVASVGFSAFLSETSAGYIQNEVKSSIAGSDVPIGYFLETKASAGAVKVFLKLR